MPSKKELKNDVKYYKAKRDEQKEIIKDLKKENLLVKKAMDEKSLEFKTSKLKVEDKIKLLTKQLQMAKEIIKDRDATIKSNKELVMKIAFQSTVTEKRRNQNLF